MFSGKSDDLSQRRIRGDQIQCQGLESGAEFCIASAVFSAFILFRFTTACGDGGAFGKDQGQFFFFRPDQGERFRCLLFRQMYGQVFPVRFICQGRVLGVLRLLCFRRLIRKQVCKSSLFLVIRHDLYLFLFFILRLPDRPESGCPVSDRRRGVY